MRPETAPERDPNPQGQNEPCNWGHIAYPTITPFRSKCHLALKDIEASQTRTTCQLKLRQPLGLGKIAYSNICEYKQLTSVEASIAFCPNPAELASLRLCPKRSARVPSFKVSGKHFPYLRDLSLHVHTGTSNQRGGLPVNLNWTLDALAFCFLMALLESKVHQKAGDPLNQESLEPSHATVAFGEHAVCQDPQCCKAYLPVHPTYRCRSCRSA